ncbi:universal stress protein [Rubrivirga sp.]|uniref:universal stress protein n=1 Tax=Rubrivirga sp. TaxID=1885344 RepID=UPI003C7410ED
MLQIRRVLFPTDYAPCADRAFAHAAFLAERLDAVLEVVHVAPVTGDARDRAGLYHSASGVERDDRIVRSPDPAEAILERSRHADLVVMGTHGRRGVVRIAVGSTTERVVRGADCPVLAVGIDAERSVPATVDRVLVPVDFSASSASALAVADALAALYDATVDVVHAVYVPDIPGVYGIGLQFPGTYPDVVSSAGRALRGLVQQHVEDGRVGEIVTRVGPPVPTILEEAERLGSGLMVTPTHGRTGLARLATGSVAEAVLRRAPCPVLSLPSFGRIPLAPDLEVERPVARPSLELADVLANHDV